jgi:hypothetical protein
MRMLGVQTFITTRACREYARLLCVLLACLLGLSARVFAADEQLEIRSPNLVPVEGIYVLNAQMHFTPPETVEQSVHDGVTLNMELQIRIVRARSWWRDEVVAQLQQRYELLYHSVSQRYLVRNVNSGAQESYATFAEAIASLQHIENLPVMDQDLLPPDARNEVDLRATVSARSIPRVLGLLLFWVDNYSLTSEWSTWPLKP